MQRFIFIHRGPSGPEEISVELDGERCAMTRGGQTRIAGLSVLPDGRLSLIAEDARQLCGRVIPRPGGEVDVVTSDATRRIALAEPLRDRLAHAAAGASGAEEDEEIRALMPGRVVEVHVAPGQTVAPGALVLVLEAMKMQNELRSSRGGRVTRVQAQAGQTVDGGALLAIVAGEPTGS